MSGAHAGSHLLRGPRSRETLDPFRITFGLRPTGNVVDFPETGLHTACFAPLAMFAEPVNIGTEETQRGAIEPVRGDA